MHPQIIQQNRKKASDKSKGDKKRTEKDKTTSSSVTSAPKDRKILVPPTNTSGTEQKKGAKRTYSDISPHPGDITQAAAVVKQAVPTE